MRPQDGSLENFPDIPGHQVILDCRLRRGRIHDPLTEPEKKEFMEHLNRCMRAANITRQQHCGDPERVCNGLNDDGLKTWLYHMRQMVDLGAARVVNGYLPTADEIMRLPGRARIGQGNSAHNFAAFAGESPPVAV